MGINIVQDIVLKSHRSSNIMFDLFYSIQNGISKGHITSHMKILKSEGI